MAEKRPGYGSRQEAVQPSLWDRLIDDLPGLREETEAMRRDLAEDLDSAEDAAELVAGGPRAIERRTDLPDATRRAALRLYAAETRRRVLEERGIVVTQDVLREAVRRDIEMLFNIERYEADQLMTDNEMLDRDTPADLIEDFTEVRSSVVNYGVPSFSGRLSTSFDKDALSADLTQVLKNYEPRLMPDTIKVKVNLSDKTGMRIEIDGVLMLSPVPERMKFSTSIDLDNGQAATSIMEV